MSSVFPLTLAEWRDREGVGLDTLARILRIEASTIERIEAGEVNPCNAIVECVGRISEGQVGRLASSPIAVPLRARSCDDKYPAAPGKLPSEARGEGGAADARAVAPPLDLGYGNQSSRSVFDIAEMGEGGGAGRSSVVHDAGAATPPPPTSDPPIDKTCGVPKPARGGAAPATAHAASPTLTGWLAKRDGGGWYIESWWDGWRYQAFSIDEARALAAELGELVAIHDAGPTGFVQVRA